MKIAYLVNQYPKVSHAFIRREILAVEKAGVDVVRWAIRRTGDAPVDPLDVEEARKTHVVLDAARFELLRAFLQVIVTRPRRFLAACRRAAALGLGSERGVLRHLAYVVEACVLLGWAKRDGVEHVHAHFGTNSATVAMLCRQLGGPSYSFTVHGPEEFDDGGRWGLRQKIRDASFVVAISNFGRSQLYRYTGFPDWSKVKLVRCGVDEDFLGPEPLPVPTARRLVSIGRLCEQKGQMLLIEALARLQADGQTVELVLVGDGELRPALEDAIRRAGLGSRVRLVGWADSTAVRLLLDQADALVLPSFAEGLPVVLMEALARGRPVLSTFVAGIPELVVPGRNGWLVPAGSVEELTAAMRAVLETSGQRLSEMGRCGRDDVRRLHDVSAIAPELVAHFRAVVGAPSVPGASN